MAPRNRDAKNRPPRKPEPIEIAELLHGLHRLAHAHLGRTRHLVVLPPALLRKHSLQVPGELVHLPAKVHVVEQLVAELLQLCPLLGCHRVEHRLCSRHALGHLLEQFLEALRVLGEEVAELVHELFEARVFAAGFDRPNIRYRVVAKAEARAQLLQFLEAEHPTDAGIVYCLSRRKVEEVADNHGYGAPTNVKLYTCGHVDNWWS